MATASNQLLTDTKSTNATGSKSLIHRSIDPSIDRSVHPSIYGATAPSGYWPLSEDASTFLCLPLFSSILLFPWSVTCPSGRLPPILFLVLPLLWATNGVENYTNQEELMSLLHYAFYLFLLPSFPFISLYKFLPFSSSYSYYYFSCC